MNLPHHPRFLSAAMLSLALFAPLTLSAQRGGRGAAPGQVAISPDGKTLAWTQNSREGGVLHISSPTDAKDDKTIAPTGGSSGCSNSFPVWSPDSSTLAFTSSCVAGEAKPGQDQIFLWTRSSGEIKQLTHITGLFKQVAFSPDGKSIAFLFVENATRSAGALDAMKPWSGVIGEDNLEIQGVYGIEVASGKGTWLVPATKDRYTFEFAWAPDSQGIAFIAAPAPGENNWWVAKLYAQQSVGVVGRCEQIGAIKGCKEDGPPPTPPYVVLDPNNVTGGLHGLQIAVPRWSPDGKKLAIIGGLMSDQGSTGGDVWVVNADGKSAPVDITPGIDGTPYFEAWLNDHTIGMVEDRRGHTVLPDYDTNSKTMIPGSAVDLGEVSVSGGAIKGAISYSDMGGTFAFAAQGTNRPPEIYVGSLQHGFDSLKQYTHLNDGAKPSAHTESVEWENEGFHVQGWLTFPANYDASKKYPLIVTVHGGPSASVGPRWGGGQWAEQGYFEFQPNPRGSFGQGEAFTQANRKDFGYGDLRDILAGLDMLEKKFPIDRKREGLTGWSYGGFMSMFAATQTNRFAAIVAGAGISDWLSYYGENSIDQWMTPFFGANVYDDPAVYAKSSAITFIKKAAEYKTPMLIIVGDRDGECPAPQSFEMWHALRDLGVKTQLVVYPNEGHGFRDPAHLRDRQERTAKWFAENMPAK